MKLPIKHGHGLAALGLWAVAAVAAAAGPRAPLADPADDRAPVPATRYEQLLIMSPAAAPTSSPPDNWKALNREVASFDSMSLTMEMQGSKSAQPQVDEQHEQHRAGAGTARMPAPEAGLAVAPAKTSNPHAAPAAKPAPPAGHASMPGMPGMPGEHK
jgi:hypothetical protein